MKTQAVNPEHVAAIVAYFRCVCDQPKCLSDIFYGTRLSRSEVAATVNNSRMFERAPDSVTLWRVNLIEELRQKKRNRRQS